jgi:hypothetical protein
VTRRLIFFRSRPKTGNTTPWTEFREETLLAAKLRDSFYPPKQGGLSAEPYGKVVEET